MTPRRIVLVAAVAIGVFVLDRIGQGYVVDFVDVGIPGGVRFWSFNVADSSIVVGIIAVTVLLWWQERQQTRAVA